MSQKIDHIHRKYFTAQWCSVKFTSVYTLSNCSVPWGVLELETSEKEKDVVTIWTLRQKYFSWFLQWWKSPPDSAEVRVRLKNKISMNYMLEYLFCFAVKIGTSDPKSRFRDISREVAQRAGEVRGMHPSRREPDRSGQRRLESRYRGWSQIGSGCINVDSTCSATHKHTWELPGFKVKNPSLLFPQPLCNRQFRSNVSVRGLSADVCWSLPSSHSLILRAIGSPLCGLEKHLQTNIHCGLSRSNKTVMNAVSFNYRLNLKSYSSHYFHMSPPLWETQVKCVCWF